MKKEEIIFSIVLIIPILFFTWLWNTETKMRCPRCGSKYIAKHQPVMMWDYKCPKDNQPLYAPKYEDWVND